MIDWQSGPRVAFWEELVKSINRAEWKAWIHNFRDLDQYSLWDKRPLKLIFRDFQGEQSKKA